MPTIIGRLTGATFQTELLVMNLLGLVNSLRNCELGWANRVDAIRSSEHLSEMIKIILCWVVKLRIIIANIYTITYLANFYSILAWCCGGTLFPWMIASAFDNFLLEFIGFAITLLLYLEKSISNALFIEYIIVRAVPRVPAIYYWCVVNWFRADLRENQRRKLMIAGLGVNREILRVSDVADHIRFGGVSHGKDYFEKAPRFTSLSNLDDFSLHSSFEYDDAQDFNKRSKSLVTLMSIDSLDSVKPEEDRTLQILDDDSLTPVEKAMKILDLSADDINEARARLGKNVLPGSSRVQKIDRVISTVEQSIADMTSTRLGKNVSSIAQDNTIEFGALREIRLNKGMLLEADESLENAGQSAKTSKKDRETSSPMKVRSIDDIARRHSREVLKISSRNPLSGCICAETNEESARTSIADLRDSVEDCSNENHRCEEGCDDSSSDVDITRTVRSQEQTSTKDVRDIEPLKLSTTVVPPMDFPDESENFPKWSSIEDAAIFPTLQISQRLALESFFLHDFRKEGMSWLKCNLAYPEDLRITNYELFRMDDITLETSEQSEENSENIDNVSNVNFQDVDTQTDFIEDSKSGRDDEEIAASDYSRGFSGTSTSTQTNIINCWKNAQKHTERSPEVSIDRESSKVSIPRVSKSKIPELPARANKIFCTFSRTRKRLRKIEENEAREMKALRAYNRLTLLEDKREMEAKKQKSTISNRVNLQGLTCASNLMSPVVEEYREFARSSVNERLNCAKIRGRLKEIPKRQTRSRPREETSKLSILNIDLDALETSISLSFSRDGKTYSRPENVKNNGNQTPTSTHRDARKQLSKYSKPMRLEDGQNVMWPSTTIIEGLQEGRDLERICGTENITGRSSASATNNNRLESVLSERILPSVDSVEITDDSYPDVNCSAGTIGLQDKRGISSMREAILSIDWGFNDRNARENDLSPHEESVDWNRENFLWDIVDETDTITLLQSAFSSNPANTSRGFYLGPGSTELYSVSNYLDSVVEEIIKTARMTPRSEAFAAQPTTEVDYGDSYLQEFKITSISTIEDSAEDTLTDSSTDSEDTRARDVTSDIDARLDRSEPVEMCWNSYSGEIFDTRLNQQSEKKDTTNECITDEREIDPEDCRKTWSLQNQQSTKSIADILGKQELSHLEFWTREIKNLASNDRRNDEFEIAREFRHLTTMPGFCVVKMLVDFFRNFVAISRSTMTSGIILTGNETIITSSPDSEEIITSQLNEASSVSIANQSSGYSQNFYVPNDDAANSRQFYFGTPDNGCSSIAELLTLITESESHVSIAEANEKIDDSRKIESVIIHEEIQAFPVTNQSFTDPKVTNDPFGPRAPLIIESFLRAGNDDVTSHQQGNQQPFDIDATFDSYDSLNSALGNSNYSDNVISIGARSSMEEFSGDALITVRSPESRGEASNVITNAGINHRN